LKNASIAHQALHFSRLMDFDPKEDFKQQYNENKPLILIVDNDCDNLLLASCVIESLGMRYVITNDSRECLQLVEELLPNLVLLDIVMPEIDGLEITRIIKQNQNKRLAAIPIIAVTGLTKPNDLQQIREVGCNDYLTKPYLIEDLESKLFKFIFS
jgi:CheY-like chemotaxis protein